MRHVHARSEQTQSQPLDVLQNVESLKEQRENLLRALAASERTTKACSDGSREQVEARARTAWLHGELRRLKCRMGPPKKYQGLDSFIVGIVKEQVSKAEWQRIVVEARRLYDSQVSRSAIGEPIASAVPSGVV
jgi:hypothetical protein